MTTKKELNDKFIEYCKEFNLTIEQSHFEEGKYITAQPGTVFLTSSDIRKGKTWAIYENLENGTFTHLYEYSSPDELFGYMEGMLTMLSEIKSDPAPFGLKIMEDQIFSAINVAEGRESTGTEIEKVFLWLKDEVLQIFAGKILYDQE